MKHLLILLLVVSNLAACAGFSTLNYPPKVWLADKDMEPTQKPKEKWAYAYADDADVELIYEMEKAIEATVTSPNRPVRQLISNKLEAMNTSNFDEAPDSTWFTNRIGRYDLDTKQIVQGPNTASGPPKRPWTILNVDPKSRPPSVLIEDSRRGRYLLTFDLPGHPALETGAAMVATLFLHAAGYNVPECHIIDIDASAYSATQISTVGGRLDEKRLATKDDIEEFLSHIDQSRGRQHIRALATKLPEGTDVGPFSFLGKRGGDINDRIPHEHRRELRGLYVFSAFLDHVMMFDAHTRDYFIADNDDKGYIRHYLVRFDDSLGSEHIEESSEIRKMSLRDSFDAEQFYPSAWSSALPNAAFDNVTYLDGLWGAKILARFTDKDIAAIVNEAKYSDANQSEYITNTLIARRDRAIKFWFSKVPPLDKFVLTSDSSGYSISFDNLAVTYGIEKEGIAKYRWIIRGAKGRLTILGLQETDIREFKIPKDAAARMKAGKIYTLTLQMTRPGEKEWSQSIDLFLQNTDSLGMQLLGIKRNYSRYSF